MKRRTLFVVIILTILMSATLQAQKSGLQSVGFAGGVNLIQGEWPAGGTIMAQIELGEVLDYLFFSPYFGFSFASDELQALETLDLNTQYFTLGTKIVGFFARRPRGIYVGGAVDFHVIRQEIATTGTFPEIKKADTNRLGMAVVAGYLMPFRKMSLFAEARYSITNGRYNLFNGLVGINFDL